MPLNKKIKLKRKPHLSEHRIYDTKIHTDPKRNDNCIQEGSNNLK